MAILEFVLGFIQFDKELREFLLELSLRLGLFLLGAMLSPVIGRVLPSLLWWLLHLIRPYVPLEASRTYNQFVKPVRNSLITTATLIFVALCLNLLQKYEGLYQFLGFFIYLALAISLAWLASRLAQRVIRLYVINLVQRLGGEVNELVLVFETLTNVIIILFAIVIFAQGLNLNLLAITASVGIGGVAVAFAAQQALERLIGTLELYLDRPYLPGEYILVNFNPYGEDVYGRVESIGLRSTKIRTAARNTLVIVPNSIMAGKNVENITRGKKVMAMLCLNFSRLLEESEKALVRQVIIESTDVFWGIDKASTRIRFPQLEDGSGTQARVSVFITGSSEDSLGLRKRLLELANEAIARKLSTHNIDFSIPEPMVYIDSPMSI